MLISNFIAFALYLLSVGLPGLALATRCALPSRAYYPPIAWLIGSALLTGELFIYFVILRLSFSPWLLVFMGIQAALAVWWIMKTKKQALRSRIDIKKPTAVSLILGVIIAIVLGLSLVQAYVKPVAAFDAVTFWSLRSKIIFVDGKVDFNPESFTYLAATSHRNYPWHVSLAEYWLRQLGGSGGELNLIIWCGFVSMVWLVCVFLLRRIRPLPAMMLTLMLASMPLVFYHSFNSYADLTLALYALGSFVMFGEFLRTGRRNLLFLSAALVGWSFFVKNEGIFYIIAWLAGALMAYSVRPKKIQRHDSGLALAALIVPILPWIIAKLSFRLGLRNTPAAPGWYPQAGEYMVQAVAMINNWNVWWFMFVGLIIVRGSRIWRNRQDWPLWANFAVSAMITAAMYLCTENYKWALDHTALSRTMISLVPLSIILAGLLCNRRQTVV